MDGVHDLGGRDNFGRVETEANEPVFHQAWERSVFSHVLAMMGAGHYCVDEFRSTTEQIPPVQYLSSSYYENWLASLETILKAKGVVTPEELDAGKALNSGTVLPPLSKEKAQYITGNPLSALQEPQDAALYEVGDEVVTRVMHPAHHTRIPGYVRGRRGMIEKNNGAFLLPDINAHGGPPTPSFNYSVRFSARELWGAEAPPNDCLYIDLFENYLERS